MGRYNNQCEPTELEIKIAEVFSSSNSSVEPTAVIVTINPTNITVVVTKMYEYVTVRLKELLGLAKIMNTDRFTVDEKLYDGCETCDYGSSYRKTFTFKQSDIGVWDLNKGYTI